MSTSSGMHDGSHSPDQSNWGGQDYSPIGGYAHGSPNDVKDPSALGVGYLKGFSPVQKKVTRDGQPAKRRGPKPDSKPAQTRRQELNRQAQRTHRERKEQYIKALEMELARLRETFANTSNNLRQDLEQHKMALHEYGQENAILKDILMSRGIPYENELDSRKAGGNMQSRRGSNTVGPSPISPRSASYQTAIPAPNSTTGYPVMPSDHPYTNGRAGSTPGSGSGATHQSHSAGAQSPLIPEHMIKREPDAISDLPGIFEKDPQLGVDFILALEATCRDHGEYLVRRSYESPDTPEEAQYSGHALMASAPPPTHISTVPAQMGGFIPTYAHQVPDMSHDQLNILLNLGQQAASQLGDKIPSGQVTPIMALQSVRGHRNYASLTREDVLGMVESIRNKVRCYGFGACMEDFELSDALSSLFATKPETYEGLPEIDDMYS